MDGMSISAGDRVRALRHSWGLQQQELADRAGVCRQTVVNLENGRHEAETATLRKFAEALGVSSGEILEGV